MSDESRVKTDERVELSTHFTVSDRTKDFVESDSSTADIPTPSIPGYEIERELGRGGMGVVYLARQVALDRLVALKMILKGDFATIENKVRFRIEAENAARVQHANIVQVYEIGEHQGMPYVALEFVEGGTLRSQMTIGQPVTPRTAAALVETLARAVHAAHQQGIVHRDLKPGNVLLREPAGTALEHATAKIADFGLAKRQDCDVEMTASGQAIGTPAYMSPEQASGRKHLVGPPADTYSLGVILFELLAGSRPFTADSTPELLRKVVEQEPPSLRSRNVSVPRDLEVICLKCLAKEPAKRYATAEALADDLRNWREYRPIMARPAGRAERLLKWCRRYPAPTALVAVSLTAGILATALATWAVRARDRADQNALNETAQRQRAEENEETAKTEAATATAVKQFLQEDLLQLASARRQHGEQAAGIKMDPDLKVRDLVLRAAQKIEGKFHDQPLVEAEIRWTLGWTLREIGRADLAILQSLRVREIYTAKLGPDHPDTLESMNSLAESYAALGRHVDALKLREETLALRQAKLGPEHPETLRSMMGLAISYYALGRYADALKLHEETLALTKSKLGPEHPDTLHSMNNLAVSYADLGRNTDALKLFEETLALRIVNLGPDHPDTLHSMYNLAIRYDTLGRHADACKLHEETLAQRKAKLGPDHPDTLISMWGVATSLSKLDRGMEAVSIIDECVQRARSKVVDPGLIPGVMDLRLQHFAKSKDAASCRATAEMWEKLKRTDAGSLYDAACMRAVTAAVTLKNPANHVARLAKEEADQAMAWLKQAIAAGYKDAAHMKKDKDLDALRDREDFKKLLAELEGKK